MQRFAALILLTLVVVGAFAVYRYAPQILLLTDKALEPIKLSPTKSSTSPAPNVSPLYENVGKELTVKEGISANAPTQQLKVEISYLSVKGSYNQYSQVSLRASGGAKNEKVDISGWKIKTSKDSWVIPRGAELYGSEAADIFVKNGDTVNVYSHSNRLNANYRLNKCIGYIKGVTPENYSSCPYTKREEIVNFSGLCQNYINSLGSCQTPDANPPVPANDSACHNFLSKLNYSGCVERYRDNSDFYSNEWRVWMTAYGNREEDIFDPYHGLVQLINREGKVVDDYTY